MTKVARAVRSHPEISSHYQFGWLDGNGLANNIVLNVVSEPGLVLHTILKTGLLISLVTIIKLIA